MGADSDMIKGALLAFEAGSDLDKADRALAYAAHRFHTATTPETKLAHRQALRRAAILFTAAAADAAAVK